MSGLLGKYVEEIVKQRHYLTEEDMELLRGVLPAQAVESDDEDHEADRSNLVKLSSLLSKSVRMAENLYKEAIKSKDSDDMKVAGVALKQVLDIAMKYSERINASDRAIKVENALIQAVESYAEKEGLPEFKSMFLDYLKQELDA